MMVMTGIAGSATEKEKLLCAQSVQEYSIRGVLTFPVLI